MNAKIFGSIGMGLGKGMAACIACKGLFAAVVCFGFREVTLIFTAAAIVANSRNAYMADLMALDFK